MLARKLLPSLSALALLALPALAQHGGGGGGGHPGGGGGGGFHGGGGGFHTGAGGFHPGPAGNERAFHAPPVFHGGQRGEVGWGDFHHDTAPTRVTPHRFAGTNLPHPGNWSGNMHDFDRQAWQGGGWQHVVHGGRMGWWWVVGPDYYYFDSPVYPYPDLYTPYGQSMGWWYWCDPYQQYYPYVTSCPVPWESVMPQD